MDIDFGAEILKNSMKFLLEASETVPNYSPALKSYFASKSRILGLQGDLTLPTAVTKSTVRCPRCCLSFTDYPPSVILKPPEETGRFLKKIQRKSDDGDTLTLYQKKRSPDVKNINCNIITKVCKNCNYESKTFLKKQIKQKIRNSAAIRTAKRKKRKKDKYCGLIQEAVINASKKEQKTEVTKQVINNTEAKLPSITLEKKKRKNKKKQEPDKVPFKQKTRKEKFIEKKQNKANKKLVNNLKTLLNDSGKSNTVVRLKSFLHDL